MAENQISIGPHPDFDTLSFEEIKAHMRQLQDDISWGTAHGADKSVITWLFQERRMAESAMARRNGTTAPTQQSEFWPELLTAEQLLTKPADPTRWVWENCLPLGASSLLVAKPKVGKSTLAVALAICVSRGWPLLGRGVQQGPVAYLSLDATFDEIKETFVKFNLKDSDPIFIHAGQAPSKALQWAIDQISKYSIKLLIVDTIQKMFRFRNINDYSEVTNAMEPLDEAARDRKCHVMYLHHAKKDSPDDLDASVGSTALRGIAYTYLHMKRLPESTQRIFRTDQRAGKNFDEICISDGQDGFIEKVGSKEDAEIRDTIPMIAEFIKNGEGPTEKEIIIAIERRRMLITKAVRHMMKENQIERTGKGGRRDPFRYYLAGTLVPDEETKPIPNATLFSVK